MQELLGRAHAARPGCLPRTSTRPSARIAGARLAGRSIPADVSLVGYDDDPLCECLEVPLTAIRMPLSELGRVAVDALIDQVEGAPRATSPSRRAPELVVRESTAAPGAR